MRARLLTVLALVLASCVVAVPARGQSQPSDQETASGEAERRRTDFRPSDETIERIQLALRADRPKGLVDPSLLDRQAVELVDGLDLVSLPIWWRPAPAAVMYGPPTHQEMLAVMDAGWYKGRPSGDLLGVATGAATSLLPAAIQALAGLFEGPPPREQWVLSDDAESAAMAFARADERVLEAHIRQRERTLDLSLVVRAGTAPDVARRLGAQFVVLVKSLVPGEINPATTIGPGAYDYLVVVRAPGGAVLASGGKSSTDADLTW